MPPKKGPVWEHFTKFEDEGYKGTPTGETKTQTKTLLAFGCPEFVYRNDEQLNNHLAVLLEVLGKSSGCKYVTSAAPGVQAKYAAELASRAAGNAMKRKIEEHRSAISVRTRDLLPTHALNLLPTLIHSREQPASPCTHSSFVMHRP
jgi:hypothetical protein